MNFILTDAAQHEDPNKLLRFYREPVQLQYGVARTIGHLPGPTFQGVFSDSHLPPPPTVDSSYVIAVGAVPHYTVFEKRGCMAEFFDPLGKRPWAYPALAHWIGRMEGGGPH